MSQLAKMCPRSSFCVLRRRSLFRWALPSIELHLRVLLCLDHVSREATRDEQLAVVTSQGTQLLTVSTGGGSGRSFRRSDHATRSHLQASLGVGECGYWPGGHFTGAHDGLIEFESTVVHRE